MLYETIQPLLAPVVLISACGLMIMSLNARSLASQSRIRRLHHERLEIAELAEETGRITPTQRQRYEGVGSQSTNLLFRLRLMRASLMSLVTCVSLMLVSSLLIGVASIDADSWFDDFAIASFVAGIISMLAGAVMLLVELGVSLREIDYEHERIQNLKLPF
ncbi:MAG: DUF2721 domain-containing protein [Planctomycetota bacterium]